MKIVYHYQNCGYGVYQLAHTEINDGEYYIFVLGIVPRKEIELLMEGERTLSSVIVASLEELEIYYKLGTYL